MLRLLAALLLCLGPCGAGETRLTAGWQFTEAEPPARVAPSAGPGWRPVTVPHGAFTGGRQGVCWYQRTLELAPEWRGRRVVLRFDAAMQVADVYVDGRLRGHHEGGYLPFFLDLSAEAGRGGAVQLAVRLDNRDDPAIPPGKPLRDLDFTYDGGLYRDVWLVVGDQLRITDAVEAGQVAGGGLRVQVLEAGSARARLQVQAHVANGRPAPVRADLLMTLRDPDGHSVAEAVCPMDLEPGADRHAQADLALSGPRLWHPDHPWLYTLTVAVRDQGAPVDQQELRVGLRRIAMDGRGFLLNGAPLRIRGSNRHQDHPWLGNAVPDRAQARDARRLRAAGFNFLRLPHYPQSPAFLDACDQLGLLVAPCVPGWQHYQRSAGFDAAVERALRELVRRDRNHPCVLYWETSLNETSGPSDAFCRRMAAAAREELPGSLAGGDTGGRWNPAKVGYDVPYTGWTDFYDRPMPASLKGRLGLHREYGDYEFGGEHSTSRQARGAGEEAQLLQAWNYQWSHNRNLGMAWTLGDATWVGIDHFRGCNPAEPVSRCGCLDAFRLPKYVYHFYRSQRDPASGPMVFLATEWTPRPGPAKVVVYSNAEAVELFLDGRSLGRRGPDAGPDAAYRPAIPGADPNYWEKAKRVQEDGNGPGAAQRRAPGVLDLIFDGGNARHLEHPPFTFTGVPFAPGELKAVAYLGGQPVAEDRRRTPGAAAMLALSLDDAGLPLQLDGSDVVWVRAELRDAAGTRVAGNGVPVVVSVDGPGEILGPAEALTEAGIASVLLRGTGGLRVLARAGALSAELPVAGR